MIVLPITHTPPSDPALALEIPASTKRRLGLPANLFRAVRERWVAFSAAKRSVINRTE